MTGIGRKIFYTIITVLIGALLFLPLVTLAAITFGCSISFLCFLVVFKGVGVIGRSLVQWWHGDDRNSPEAIARRERTAAYAKREARAHSESRSQSSSSNTTTRSQSRRSTSNVSLASLPQNPPQLDRDYEGVGGWLIQRDNNDRNSKVMANNGKNDNNSRASSSNLDGIAEAPPLIFRRRSFSASSTGINSPEVLSTPSLPSHSSSTAMSRQYDSPEVYFNSGAAARSTASFSRSRRNSRVATTEVFED